MASRLSLSFELSGCSSTKQGALVVGGAGRAAEPNCHLQQIDYDKSTGFANSQRQLINSGQRKVPPSKPDFKIETHTGDRLRERANVSAGGSW